MFRWGQTSSKSIEFGDEEWELGNQKTPRTFVEIDAEGMARVKGWQFETVLDIAEMRHKGPELLIKTADGSKKRLNGRRLVEKPRDQQRTD